MKTQKEITQKEINDALFVLQEIGDNPYLTNKFVKALNIPYADLFFKTAEEMEYINIPLQETQKCNVKKRILLIAPEPIHARKLIESMQENARKHNKAAAERKKKTSNNKGQKMKHFQKPTVEEIQNYCKGRGNSINAQKFYNYYESKGWIVGKSKMKDWTAAVRTWEINQKKYEPEMAQKKEKPEVKTVNVDKVKLDPSKTYRLKQNLKGVIQNNYKLQYRYLYAFWKDTGMTFESVDDFKRKVEIAKEQVIKL